MRATWIAIDTGLAIYNQGTDEHRAIKSPHIFVNFKLNKFLNHWFSMMTNLKKILAQPDTIIFLGSGISLWSGLPTWSGMIEELAKFLERGAGGAELVRAEAKKGDLLQAASYGFDKLTKQQIGEFIREACRYGRARPHEIHHKIVSLGPRCFITTNYDDLIEQSLREWQPDRFYRPPVTNRHLTETAEIVHARSIDFIFKPHGDAADSESIILTREQYRRLLPQGENQAALESVKMLLASRPVLYLGFGLRDPDFIYIRDLLANTYKGGIRDHYAIMADVQEQEIDYWRRNYGIHLLGYNTVERADGAKDHSPLLTLLDSFLEFPTTQSISTFNPNSADVLLALARHAAVLGRYSICHPELPIRVNLDREQKKLAATEVRRFDYGLVEKLLDSGPERLVLTGLPGAGKTYSLHRAAARLADQLNEICLSDSFNKESITIPIIVDLKLYKGDLNALISQILPEGLPFQDLIKSYKVKIFVDSFNEMPREYLESGSYEADFLSFISAIGQSSLIIGSRTTDGLSRLELPSFHLDQIERKAIERELIRLDINFEGRFSNEIFDLAQRPFYFQHIISGRINLPKEAHPRDFYRCFLDKLRSAFLVRFYLDFDIEKALSNTAYAALDKGSEAFLISLLIGELSALLPMNCRVTPMEVINWLVSESILIPYSKGRIGFVHQSITEYLAATELARRYESDPRELKEKLALRRWDQALFLALSFLSNLQAKDFIDDVVRADMILAINASKYIESGRDEVVLALLNKLYELKVIGNEFSGRIEHALAFGVQASEVHETVIRKFIDFGSTLGGAAVCLLLSIKGAEVKQEVIHMLYERRGDFNFGLRIGDILAPHITEEDSLLIASLADLIQSETESNPELDEDSYSGFIYVTGKLLSKLELPALARSFSLETNELVRNPFRAKLLCKILGNNISTEALLYAGDLLINGIDEAASTMAKIAVFSDDEDNICWDGLNYKHAARLQDLIENFLIPKALQALCRERSDIANYIKTRAQENEGLLKALLLHCTNPKDMAPVFSELERIAALEIKGREGMSFDLLTSIDIDWQGHESLFVKLLKLRDVNLTNELLGSSIPVHIKNLGILELGDIRWWLEWMRDEDESANDVKYWFLAKLGDVLGHYISKHTRAAFLEEFNQRSEFRRLIYKFIIPRMDVTTDEIGSEATSFLLAELSRGKIRPWSRDNILGAAATEDFIAERLMPLLINAQEPLKGNLLLILELAGTRHGRRYLVES
ncbi:SIR2 family NAD-dependent protein deacylase [Pseudomonas viridiflava]|uniref:SIR2 family NAD-dependent protein deacylase n=1 Tax=Pseudomonas viridiflava TaxID=33069 RepID=UPI0020C087FA|nr:SIR2 family protein [Pseudomonas viridiflava]